MFLILENSKTALKFCWQSLTSFDVYGCVYCSAQLLPLVLCSSSLKTRGLPWNILLIKDIDIYCMFEKRLPPPVWCFSSLKTRELLWNVLLIKDIEIYYIFERAPPLKLCSSSLKTWRLLWNFFDTRWDLLMYMVVYIAQHVSCCQCYVPRPWKLEDC